ncbi:raffinose/stachyose/melibiose transport system substrate-binding protein [Streptomyces sp. V4I23]|uniref:ABC transporter substrate-binding protein n=1 Tax=Streptomyces sp. V4I23 TaxID=3042282 RepID=UPI002781DBA8|nr:extracellular solute-binding protein [Streptomyces sp. V4I23]MDQ1006790.1 raffinose/stachyose/melibiose transport system substrate-binding protein [Streptomyces sp. V4I23]
MIRARGRAAVSACLAAVLLSACGSPPQRQDEPVSLDFFQFKPEAVETFDKLIADFEAEHPGIEVKQHHVPEPETAIRARLVKDNVPDVISLNGNSTFGELASAGVFYDFSREKAADEIVPGVQQVLSDLGTASEGEVNGLPFASNASGVLYNKGLFAKYGVEVPRTWDELIEAAKTFEEAGVIPFYGALKDAWTSLPPFNQLAANAVPPDAFWDARIQGRTSFAKEYPEVARKLAEIYRYTQKNTFSRDYNAANQAFARGEAAMYVQGSYALPPVKSFKPAFDIGLFPLPAGNDPGATRLVSGVDVALTMGRTPRHPKESMAFITYLMRPEVVSAYAEEQSAIPPLKGTAPSDPALRPLLPYVTDGRITGYPDHRIPRAVNLEAVAQQFLIDGRQAAFLRTLDSEYTKVVKRRS